MNMYREQKEGQQKRMDDFLHKYAFFAFSESQFEEGLQKLGIEELKKGQLVRIPGGGFVLKEHVQTFKNLIDTFEKERAAALEDEETGQDFAYHMFYYELCNHEYSYTGDLTDTLYSLGYELQDIKSNPKLEKALIRASNAILKEE